VPSVTGLVVAHGKQIPHDKPALRNDKARGLVCRLVFFGNVVSIPRGNFHHNFTRPLDDRLAS